MPPSVLTSNDRADVESALASQPKFTDPQVKALYNWVLRLVTALFNYVSYFLGDNADRHDSLENRVQDLEDKLQESQTSSIPTTTPHTIRSDCRRRFRNNHRTRHHDIDASVALRLVTTPKTVAPKTLLL